jgi:hypothetical protein
MTRGAVGGEGPIVATRRSMSGSPAGQLDRAKPTPGQTKASDYDAFGGYGASATACVPHG